MQTPVFCESRSTPAIVTIKHEVSSARLNSKPDQKHFKPQVQTILKHDDFDFPPGIERIGNGIGYTYSLPVANRSKLSICTSAPRPCHGTIWRSSKLSGLGIELGQLTSRRPKSSLIKKSVQTKGRSPRAHYGKTRMTARLGDGDAAVATGFGVV